MSICLSMDVRLKALYIFEHGIVNSPRVMPGNIACNIREGVIQCHTCLKYLSYLREVMNTIVYVV